MSKIVAFGDLHGRSVFKLIIAQNPDADVFICMGDEFDSFEFNCLEQMVNFQELMEYKEKMGDKLICLIGNHTLHYFPEIGDSGTSGYQKGGAATSISHLINENRDYLQMAYAIDNILFTHAGVGESWMQWIVDNKVMTNLPNYSAGEIADWVNDLWKYKPRTFNFNGRESSGDDLGQTPVWIRPRSLMKDSQKMKKAGIIQVVGHTQMNQIDIKGKATGGKYFFIDTLGTSGEYLIKDGKFCIGKTR